MAGKLNPLEPFGHLNQLRIESSCGTSWERMEGGFRERHCERCAKTVHDFRRLTALEADRRIAAHRGNICARLTRDAKGDLVFLGGSRPPEATSSGPRRAQPAAAYLLTALLGAASAAAQSPADDGVRIESVGDAQGLDLPDPSTELPPVFDESLPTLGERGETVSVGVILAIPDSLYLAFAESPLVVLATVGETAPIGDPEELESDGGYGEVESELEIEVVLRGTHSRGPLRLRYYAYVAAPGDETESTIYPEGATVLALLMPSTDEAGAVFYEAQESFRSPQVLTQEEAEAYRIRLEALARVLDATVEKAPSADGEEDVAEGTLTPEALAEWLVGTAEEPLTRAEAIEDLRSAVLTEGQRHRLLSALLVTERLADSDLSLFEQVREWAPVESSRWLRQAAGQAAWSAARGAEELPGLRNFRRAAEALQEDDLAARIGATEERIDDLAYEDDPDTDTESSDQRAIVAVEAETITRDLLLAIAEELENSSQPSEVAVRTSPAVR